MTSSQRHVLVDWSSFLTGKLFTGLRCRTCKPWDAWGPCSNIIKKYNSNSGTTRSGSKIP